MSEYQYYEFQAIDRPLTTDDLQMLRAISSRAKITPTSLTNTYEWGDFKGDPVKLMARCFDLHLYLANWGSRQLMIRLPKSAIDREWLDTLIGEVDQVRLHAAGDNVVLDVSVDEVDQDDWDDGSGWLAALAPLRDDLLGGDPRLFYVLWLMGVQSDAYPPDVQEPLPGLGPLTGALEALANFFAIDADLVAAAAEQCPYPAVDPAETDMTARATIAALTDEARSALLPRAWQGDAQVGHELRSLVRQNSPRTRHESMPARTVGDLLARAAEIAEARERAAEAEAEAEQRRRNEEAARIRRVRLDALARRGEAVWHDVEAEIARRNAQGYDRATELLADLQALAEEKGAAGDFLRRLQSVRVRHATKGRLIERLQAMNMGDDALI